MFIEWVGVFFSDQPQIGNLPLTPSALFHIIPAVEATWLSNEVIRFGGIAQLGERLHGMQEVSGSIPLISTNQSTQFRISLFSISSSLSRYDFSICTLLRRFQLQHPESVGPVPIQLRNQTKFPVQIGLHRFG